MTCHLARPYLPSTAAALLPLTPLGTYLGFVTSPPLFFLILLGMVLGYLLVVEWVKRWFYRRYGAAHA